MIAPVGASLQLHWSLDKNMSILANRGLFPLVPLQAADGSWEVVGELSNIVHVKLAPGQQIQCVPGALIYGSNDVKAKIRIGGFERLLTQGNFIKLNYGNSGSSEGYIGIASNFPGTVIPFNLDELGGSIACKHDAFLGSMDPECRIECFPLQSDSIAACCCSGMPMFMEKVSAKGWVWLVAHGTIMRKTLTPGEEIAVDTASVVAVSTTVRVDVRRTGACATMCCSQEGLFNTTLKGPGDVVLTSMSIEKVRRLFPTPARANKSDKMSANSAGD